jgi:8-oxo-dGTP pyrophosphatase MutT (NUDIX family)
MPDLATAGSVVTIPLQQIEHLLAKHQPRRKPLRRLLNRAAVAIILRESPAGTEILMIKRSERKGDPWSGHMAFPGGRMDRTDRHGFDVACRETEEEIGLKLTEHDRCIGRLSEIMTHFQLGRRAMVVSPYVFRLDREAEFTLNHEVAEVIWVPLGFLMDPANREKMKWTRRGIEIPLPCYMYRGRRIWGLSLMMLGELLELLE